MGYQGNYPPSTPLTSSQIATGAVDANALAAGAVTTAAIASDAVVTADIANGAVTAAKIASGVITPAAVSSQSNSATDYFTLPTGTTAQRPGSPAQGMVRFNTTTGAPEWYDTASTLWVGFNQGKPYTIQYLVVAGGGAGGAHGGSGGGAGGYRNSTTGEQQVAVALLRAQSI